MCAESATHAIFFDNQSIELCKEHYVEVLGHLNRAEAMLGPVIKTAGVVVSGNNALHCELEGFKMQIAVDVQVFDGGGTRYIRRLS